MFYAVSDVEEYDPENIEIQGIEIETSVGKILVALINEQQEEDFIERATGANFRPVRLVISENDLTNDGQVIIL